MNILTSKFMLDYEWNTKSHSDSTAKDKLTMLSFNGICNRSFIPPILSRRACTRHHQHGGSVDEVLHFHSPPPVNVCGKLHLYGFKGSRGDTKVKAKIEHLADNIFTVRENRYKIYGENDVPVSEMTKRQEFEVLQFLVPLLIRKTSAPSPHHQSEQRDCSYRDKSCPG